MVITWQRSTRVPALYPFAALRTAAFLHLVLAIQIGCSPRLSTEEAQVEADIEANVATRRLPGLRDSQRLSAQIGNARPGNPRLQFVPGGRAFSIPGSNRINTIDLTSCFVDDELLTKLQRLPELRYLQLADSTISDESLKYVAELKTLERLDLSLTAISDAGLCIIDSLSQLRALELYWCMIGDEGLKCVGELPHLVLLGIGSCAEVTDRGIEYLDRLSELTEINLDDTQITDRAMASLSRHVKLKALWLNETSIGDLGLMHLSKLVQLERLYLGECRTLTDEGISYLPRLSKLWILDLAGTAVSDECVDDLAQMVGLKQLFVQGTAITASGRARLREALPECSIAPLD